MSELYRNRKIVCDVMLSDNSIVSKMYSKNSYLKYVGIFPPELNRVWFSGDSQANE